MLGNMCPNNTLITDTRTVVQTNIFGHHIGKNNIKINTFQDVFGIKLYAENDYPVTL